MKEKSSIILVNSLFGGGVCSAQKGLIRALSKSAVCLVNLSANGAKVAGKVPAKDF